MSNEKKNPLHSQKFGHLYDRQLVKDKAFMILKSFEANPFNIEGYVSSVTTCDLCVVLYKIDMAPFMVGEIISAKNGEEINIENTNDRLTEWLKTKYFVYWLLTCNAIDDLIEDNLVIRNSAGKIQTVKRT